MSPEAMAIGLSILMAGGLYRVFLEVERLERRWQLARTLRWLSSAYDQTAKSMEAYGVTVDEATEQLIHLSTLIDEAVGLGDRGSSDA